MKRASKFSVSQHWKLLLIDMGIEVASVLAYAKLPADLFSRELASLTPAEYFNFWNGLELAAEGKDIPLLLAKHISAEAFDPPIFASICSPNLNSALHRLSHYKPLIGPMVLDINEGKKATRMEITCYGYKEKIPKSLGLTELVFFTQLSRIATRKEIKPVKIELLEMPENKNAYEDYFGCKLTQSKTLAISFSHEDANRPFLTSNLAMWDFFEDKLNQSLAELDKSASTVDRVRAVLIEMLPSGDSSIDTVTQRLAMSKRTLQRKLTAEAETFKTVLQSVRSELADHYLENSTLPLTEIAFLLGFQESNSFIRAYSSWKGISPGSFRDQLH
ncbi:MAG: AraC family transcriptional regulator [Pseudomonadales bacterium]|nr:AraC family transcriptional regulator [Pseudomonadales bacterium]